MPAPKGSPKPPGSGRKPGTPNKATAAIKDLARVYTAEALETLGWCGSAGGGTVAMATNQEGPMTPGTHADLVARLRKFVTEYRKIQRLDHEMVYALHSEYEERFAPLRLSDIEAAADALAALPPPADPPHDCEAWRLEGLGCARCNKADPPALVALGERLRTQDNQMTAHPIFVVEHRNDARRPWEFVTACLTDEGARAYMNANGHNLRKFSRIFVHSGYRNDQWIGLRNHLMALPAAPPVTASAPTYVEIDPDGDLSIDFDRANDRVVSLTVYQDGRVGYSAFVGGKSAHGIVTAAEPMPVWVRAAICAPPVTDTCRQCGDVTEQGRQYCTACAILPPFPPR